MKLLRRLLDEVVANKSLLLFLGLMLMFRSAVADWMQVPTGSMNPTIVEGDRILVDKAAYGLRVPFTNVRLTHGGDPQRGDIVIFPSPTDTTLPEMRSPFLNSTSSANVGDDESRAAAVAAAAASAVRANRFKRVLRLSPRGG